MSRFKGKDLFGSGAHAFHAHGAVERLVEHAGPGVDGVGLTGLGRVGRRIDQEGKLLGDDLVSLMGQVEAIELEVGAAPGELVDELGRVWSGASLVSFEPGDVDRVGVRWCVRYRACYVCVGG
jgi:hypothetical protein